MRVSIFKDIYSTGKDVDLGYVLDRIKTGGDFGKTITSIRNSQSEEEQQRLKKTLPGVTFCGTFKARRIQDLIEASGLVILDFDTPGVVLEDSPFFYATWRSPRGGMKALVKIPVVKSDQEFKQYFYALQARFTDVDPSGKDISRFCFMRHDPDIKIGVMIELALIDRKWTKLLPGCVKYWPNPPRNTVRSSAANVKPNRGATLLVSARRPLG